MRSVRHGAAVLLAFVVGSTTVAFGQVAQGGFPWKWGADLDLSAIPSVTTAALDLETLAAEDAVTDQYKEAPWRFGVEREVDLGLEDAGDRRREAPLKRRTGGRGVEVSPPSLTELKGSVGEGPNHSNYSDRSSVRILAKFRNFR